MLRQSILSMFSLLFDPQNLLEKVNTTAGQEVNDDRDDADDEQRQQSLARWSWLPSEKVKATLRWPFFMY
jgi:hypothetical protein